jgi:PKD repeat protein
MAGSIDVAVPNTASSTTYAYANATLRLKPGLNTIQFTYHGSAMNFDYFTLDPSGIPVATPTPTPTPLQLVVVPGGRALPGDWENDGLYEDVNGNGRKDFADVVLYFNQMTWIAANEPVPAFDYNGNGRIDFADVVWLFNHL